jgi:hypothetical protein
MIGVPIVLHILIINLSVSVIERSGSDSYAVTHD